MIGFLLGPIGMSLSLVVAKNQPVVEQQPEVPNPSGSTTAKSAGDVLVIVCWIVGGLGVAMLALVATFVATR